MTDDAGKLPGQQPDESDVAYAWRVIQFALTIDDHYDARTFLEAATEGNGDTLKEWPEFMQGDERPIPF